MKAIYNSIKDRVRNTTIYGLYGKSYEEHIDKIFKVGKKFLHLNNNNEWETLTITYIRSGVYFFVIDDKPEEHYGLFGSFATATLHPETIDLNEYKEFLNECFDDEEFVSMILDDNTFDTLNGRIKIISIDK